MPDFLLYRKNYWKDLEKDSNCIDEIWHTGQKPFFDKVEQGDSLWVVVTDGSHHPAECEWRLLQRMVVQEKSVDYRDEYHDRPYRTDGDYEKGQRFDVEAQFDLTPLLHKLDFKSGRRITDTGKKIGNSLQKIRPLSESDSALLKEYAKDLKRH